jgi:hypothetical protein
VGLSVPAAFVFELIPVNAKLWIYWGNAQPLVIWSLPAWWAFCNTAAVSISAACLFLFRKYALGDRHTWAFVLMLPLGVIGAHMIVTYPAITAISSSTDIVVTTVGAVGAIVLSGLVVFVFGKLLTTLAPTPGHQASLPVVAGVADPTHPAAAPIG